MEPKTRNDGLTVTDHEDDGRPVFKVVSKSNKKAVKDLQTEGHGYGADAVDVLDSHDPRNQD